MIPKLHVINDHHHMLQVEATYSKSDKTIYVHLHAWYHDKDPCKISDIIHHDDEKVPVQIVESYKIKDWWYGRS